MSGNPSQEEDKKPGDQAAHINLKVKGQVILLFRIAFLFICLSFFSYCLFRKNQDFVVLSCSSSMFFLYFVLNVD